MPYGIIVKHDQEGKRVEIQCMHHNGLVYVVPSEANWVCSQEYLHAHALAGFLGDLARLQEPQVRELMQRWGLYYRERPLQEEKGTS